MAYSKAVLDHFENPRNVGKLDKDSPNVGTGLVGAPAIASSSLLTEWVKGKTLTEAEQIKNTEIADELALPPIKIHCSVLAEDAIKTAIADLKGKQESSGKWSPENDNGKEF